MDEKLRTALSAPFPENQVKTRPGSFGNKPIQYLESSTIVARLSDVCQGDWSFTILSHEVLENGEVLVHGRLEALGVVKEAFGRCASVNKDGEVIRALGDCYKAAATQSLTVCCRLLSIAAYLYSEDYTDTPNDQPQRLVPRSAAPQRASAKQVSAIWAIGRKLGLDANAIRQRCFGDYGAFPEQLDKQTASAFIQVLGSEVDAQQGAA